MKNGSFFKCCQNAESGDIDLSSYLPYHNFADWNRIEISEIRIGPDRPIRIISLKRVDQSAVFMCMDLGV